MVQYRIGEAQAKLMAVRAFVMDTQDRLEAHLGPLPAKGGRLVPDWEYFWPALLACAQMCVASPPAPNGADVRKIAWNKGAAGMAFRDEHGVCHAFAHDTRAGLQMLGDQVKACFERSLPERTRPS